MEVHACCSVKSVSCLTGWHFTSNARGVLVRSFVTLVQRRVVSGEVIIIINNFCVALFSGVPKLTALYNSLQHFLSFTNIIHIIMKTNNV